MKIPFVLELLFISALIAFVSSKNVNRRIARVDPKLEITTLKANITSAENSVRQDDVSQDIQIVQELTDSQEAVVAPVEADSSVDVKPISVENNDIEPKPSTEKPINENDPNPINKFCSCSSATCKCCRDFNIPFIPIRGPGCATVRYLDNDRLSIGIKYGDLVLASRTVDSRRPTPICLPLPGGYNRFCGRVYGISRQDENFKACLGLELRADDDVEASLRVSCFQFGPKGLATMEAEPLPPNITDEDEDEDEDDEDDDPLGIGELAGGDDDDDDDDDDSDEAPGAGGFVGDVLGGLLGGAGGGGGDDDDDDFGLTRFFGSAGDIVTDFFGGNSNEKKKPNEAININRRNDVKPKKKPEIVKKTPKNSASKLKADADDQKDASIMGTIEETLEEFAADDDEEQPSNTTTERVESTEAEHEENDETNAAEKTEKDYEDEEVDEDDDYEEDYNEVNTEKNKETKSKPVKKKKASSSFGFGYFGRFFNIFS